LTLLSRITDTSYRKNIISVQGQMHPVGLVKS